MEQFIREGFNDSADVPAGKRGGGGKGERGQICHFHLVGAVIAVSSSTKQPIDTLRNLDPQLLKARKLCQCMPVQSDLRACPN